MSQRTKPRKPKKKPPQNNRLVFLEVAAHNAGVANIYVVAEVAQECRAIKVL